MNFVMEPGPVIDPPFSNTCVPQLLAIIGEPDVPGRDAVSIQICCCRVVKTFGSEAMLARFQIGSPPTPIPYG
jgi:hypothetical protein